MASIMERYKVVKHLGAVGMSDLVAGRSLVVTAAVECTAAGRSLIVMAAVECTVAGRSLVVMAAVILM